MRCYRLQKRKSNNANFNFLKITIMKKVKVFIAMIAVALGGLIIWSCTQDEMENGQGTYRYSAEEIVTLRAMAEKYGVTVPQLCIRYTLQLGAISLPKTANPEHMKTNAEVDFEISAQDMEVLKNFKKIESYGASSGFPVYSGKM